MPLFLNFLESFFIGNETVIILFFFFVPVLDIRKDLFSVDVGNIVMFA